jgi:hypothetical protein
MINKRRIHINTCFSKHGLLLAFKHRTKGETVSIFRSIFFIAIAVLTIGATGASAAVITNWESGDAARTLQSQFLSAHTTQTETFESFDHLDTPSMKIAFGSITGGGYVSDNTGLQFSSGEYAANGTKFFSNGTTDSMSGKHDFTVNLNTPQHALGFFAMDWQDIGGRVSLSLGEQLSQSIDIFTLVGKHDSGTLIYFTLLSDIAFDSITFHKSGGDGYAIDDLSVAATPIPGAVWILGSGLIGLIGLRRKYHSA